MLDTSIKRQSVSLVAVPPLFVFWHILKSFDWATYAEEINANIRFRDEWHEKFDPLYWYILDVADASQPHEDLAAAFEYAAIHKRARPPLPTQT